ncbi:hypothetical protein [Rhodococcus sp. 008]|uniref:hypothetical protein n=1 Tax=Rhodococcus sp. 008 TaxID=1723645 RepID=UPI0008063FC0|nr:hypothetical protein [Rhodococcus sp. 008]ANQ74335.1 hypothetical protein AOT96_28575 [Rhodococcus sp. 008]
MPTVKHDTGKAEDASRTPFKNCRDFNAEMLPKIEISGKDPNPWLADDAPRWSSPDHDVLNNPGSDVCQPDHAEWRSTPLRMPHTTKYAVVDVDGNWTTATICANISQKVGDRYPRINFESHGFNAKGDPVGEDTPLNKYSLTLEDAGYLARALLLLIDLATGMTDDLGEVDHK